MSIQSALFTFAFATLALTGCSRDLAFGEDELELDDEQDEAQEGEGGASELVAPVLAKRAPSVSELASGHELTETAELCTATSDCDGVGAFCDIDEGVVGTCRQHCGGIAGLTCDAGTVCVYPDNGFVVDALGTCMPVLPAPICPLSYAPVCGVSGETYGNVCWASAAEAEIAHLGPCEDDDAEA